MGAIFGRGVSVEVTDGVTGEGVIVKVDVREGAAVAVAVGLGLAVNDGVTEAGITGAVAGAQASARRTIKINKESLFIQLNANSY